jgi:hypothetical protein
MSVEIVIGISLCWQVARDVVSPAWPISYYNLYRALIRRLIGLSLNADSELFDWYEVE